MRYLNVAPCCLFCALTGAAEPLLPQTQQHVLTHIAVGWFVEMLHSPDMLTIPLCFLTEREGGGGYSWFVSNNACSAST